MRLGPVVPRLPLTIPQGRSRLAPVPFRAAALRPSGLLGETGDVDARRRRGDHSSPTGDGLRSVPVCSTRGGFGFTLTAVSGRFGEKGLDLRIEASTARFIGMDLADGSYPDPSAPIDQIDGRPVSVAECVPIGVVVVEQVRKVQPLLPDLRL